MMEMAPLSVASAAVWAMARVPRANAGFSKTPMGPFQTMVQARANSAENTTMLWGPMSRPIQPGGVAEISQVSMGAESLRFLPST